MHPEKHIDLSLGQKVTIHKVTTMLATSNNVLFPGPNHLLTVLMTLDFDYHISWCSGDN